MSLVKCRECGKDVSGQAPACPHCGIKNPAPRETKAIVLILAALLVTVGVGFCHFRGDDRAELAFRMEQQRRSSMTAEARAAEDKANAERKVAEKAAADAKEANFQRALRLVQAIKTQMKDPSSLDISDAGVTSDGAIGITYRGKNSFGALVLNYAVLTKDGKIAIGSEKDVASLWNRHIAGKGATDLTSSLRGAKLLGAY